jgi:hypothetical protein
LSFDRFYDAEFNPTGPAAPTSIAKPGKPNRHCPVSPWLDPDRSGFEVALGLVALCLGHFKKTLTELAPMHLPIWLPACTAIGAAANKVAATMAIVAPVVFFAIFMVDVSS